jgi:E3 ubiquitin-protein ligase UBR4
MKVVYRMRGLLGDATEDMIETLNDNKDEDIDEEEVFKMAAVLGQCNRLDAILLRLSHARHFMRSHGMIKAGLKLLGYCVKVKTNRQYLIQSHLNTLKILLNILNMALEHEQIESSGIGATVAQQVLSVTEPILQESSIQQRVIVRSMSDELTVVESSEEHTTLQMLLKHIESPFVQSNLGVREGLMHIIPFLTFGDPLNMTVLLQHFAPYLDFERLYLTHTHSCMTAIIILNRFDNEKTPEHSLYLDCFSVVATGIGVSLTLIMWITSVIISFRLMPVERN